MTSHHKLKVHTGKYFPKPIVLIGYICIIFGIIELMESLLIGFTLITIGSYLSFNQAGFEIEDGRFRNFFYLLHFKIGKWQTSELSHIAIVKRRLVRKTYGGRTPVSVTEKQYVYEITLLSETQLKRLKLLRLKDINKAEATTDKIANLLNVKKID